jgi:hypothetical protein
VSSNAVLNLGIIYLVADCMFGNLSTKVTINCIDSCLPQFLHKCTSVCILVICTGESLKWNWSVAEAIQILMD